MEGCTTAFQYKWEIDISYSLLSERFRAASWESSLHEVGTPHDSLTTVTAELEITLCSSSPPVSVDPVQSSLAHLGVDYLKEEENLLAFYIRLFHPKS